MEPEKRDMKAKARNRKTSLFQLICLFPLNRPFFRLPPLFPCSWFCFFVSRALGQLLLQHCKVSLCVCSSNVSRLFFYCFTTCFWIYNFWGYFRQKPRNFRGLFGEKHNLAVFSTPLFCMMPPLLYINMRQECLQIW